MRHLLFLCVSLCVSFTACGRPPQPALSSSEALSKFQAFCKAELKYPVITRLVGKTLWIYLPGKDPLTDMQATTPQQEQTTKTPTEKIALRFYDARFKNGDFIIEFDAGTHKIYSQDQGYKSIYTESFQKQQNNILTALQRTLFDAPDAPEFVTLVITDVTRGIEVETITNFDDFKKASIMPPALSQDEYTKRYLSAMRGNRAAIGDMQGRHLSWAELTWPDFLSRQIKNRIRFKYQQSDFPPSDDAKKEIAQIARDTLQAYNFSDYEGVILEDLNTGETFTLK